MIQATPFRLLNNDDCNRIQALIETQLNAWSKIWFSVSPEIGFALDEKFAVSPESRNDWRILTIDHDNWVAWHFADASWRDYARLLLGASVGPVSVPSPLINDLLRDCMTDLASRILVVTDEDAKPIASTIESLAHLPTGYGSGAIQGKLCNGLPSLFLAIGGGTVASLLGPRPSPESNHAALASRESAIGSELVHLDIVLGSTELSLAELANISVGDVIRVQSPYQQPVIARGSDGIPLLKVHLGTRGERKAIQVVGKES